MDALVHIISLIGGIVSGIVSLYVSYRILKNKEDILDSAKEIFPSKDSFDAHEKQDQQRFTQMEAAEARRHTELREDVSRVEKRVDGFIMGHP